jgi:FGGY-family pentulose kinase
VFNGIEPTIPMSFPLYLGLDVGTQSLRAALFDGSGACRGFGISRLDTTHPQPAWAEQDARQWWAAACAAVPEALAKANASPTDIAAIGLDCTACTVIPSKADGTPLRNALLWMDQRSFREAEEISATGDPILRYVSGVVSPEWMLPKALWLKRHERKVYDAAERLVECTDWFMYKLTGDWSISLNNVTVKWDYARPDGGWSERLFRQAGLDNLAAKWPAKIVPLGKGDARLSAAAAKELGLVPSIPVAQGGIDAYLGMLGMGAVGAGDLAMILGSSTCHLAMSNKALFGSGMLGCYPDAVVAGLYTLEGGQTATGSILDWYRRHFAGNEAAEAARLGKPVYELLDAKAAEVAPGSDGLVCLDYWQGNRCPLKDPRARGTLWGLTLSHGPGHVFRAIYEATAYGTRHILEDVAKHGLRIERLFAGGGGAKSRLWLQIQADILGLPIHVPRESEACALGSAMVAAVHTGHYPDLATAARRMVQIGDVVEPEPANRAAYDYYYGKYLATYPALRDLMHDLVDNRP